MVQRSSNPRGPNWPELPSDDALEARLSELFHAFRANLRVRALARRAQVQRSALWAVAGLVGLLWVASVVLGSARLLLSGLRGAFTELFGGRAWMGDLATAGLALAALAVCAVVGLRVSRRALLVRARGELRRRARPAGGKSTAGGESKGGAP